MRAAALALAIFAGACSSNNGSKEKLDAGQRKYCDVYCADASPDTRVAPIDLGGVATDVALEPDLGPSDLPMGDLALSSGDSRPAVDITSSGGQDGGGTGGTGGAGGAGGSTVPHLDAADAPVDLRDAPSDSVDAPTDASDAPGDVVDAPDGPIDGGADGDGPGPLDGGDAPGDVGDAPQDTPMDGGSPTSCALAAPKGERALPQVSPSMSRLAFGPDGVPWLTGSYFAALDLGGKVLAHGSDTKADAFLAKLNPATGQATEAFSFTDVNAANQNANGVALASGGNVAVIGFFSGEIDFDGNNADGSGPSGVAGDVGKDYLQSSASIPYYAVISGSSTGATASPILSHMVDVGQGSILAVGSNPTQNAFAICGKTSKAVAKWNANGGTKGLVTTTTGATAGGGMDIIVAKIDATTGVPVWGLQFGGAGDQLCESVTIDNNGDVILAGAYTGALDFGGATSALPVVADTTLGLLYVAKLKGADGSGLLAKTWGATGRSDAFALTVDRDNNVIVGGSLGGNVDFGGGVSLVNAGHTDGFVVKLSNALVATWGKVFGDAGYDQNVQSVATNSAGDVLIGGSFKGALTGLAITSASNGSSDAFAAQLAGNDGSPRPGPGGGLCAFAYGDAPGAQSVGSLAVARTATGTSADAVFMVGDFASTITFGTTKLYSEDKSQSCALDAAVCPSGEPCSPGGFCASATATASYVTRF